MGIWPLLCLISWDNVSVFIFRKSNIPIQENSKSRLPNYGLFSASICFKLYDHFITTIWNLFHRYPRFLKVTAEIIVVLSKYIEQSFREFKCNEITYFMASYWYDIGIINTREWLYYGTFPKQYNFYPLQWLLGDPQYHGINRRAKD